MYLLKIILGIAMNSPDNQEYISRITELDENTQTILSDIIQEVMSSVNFPGDDQPEVIDLENEEFRDFDELENELGLDMNGELREGLDMEDVLLEEGNGEVFDEMNLSFEMEGNSPHEQQQQQPEVNLYENDKKYIQVLLEQLDVANQRIDELEATEKTLTASRIDILKEVEDLQLEINSITAEKDELKKMVETMKMVEEEKDEKLRSEEISKLHFQEEVEKLEKDIENLTIQQEKSKEQLRQALAEKAEIETKLDMMNAELVEVRHSNLIFQEKYQQLEQQLIQQQQKEKEKEMEMEKEKEGMEKRKGKEMNGEFVNQGYVVKELQEKNKELQNEITKYQRQLTTVGIGMMMWWWWLDRVLKIMRMLSRENVNWERKLIS